MKGKAQKASLAGSLMAAFMASICCIGPVLFALLGVSGAAFTDRFEAYRPIFIIVSVALLGTAFYFTYRKKPAEQCSPGTYCANPKSDRINKIILWTAALFVVLFIFFPGIISRLAWASEASRPSIVERNYLIQGMTCAGCVFGVKKALRREGLSKDQIEDVDYRSPDPKHAIGHARVLFRSAQYQGLATDCRIIRAIRMSPGYVAYLNPANLDPCGLNKKEK